METCLFYDLAERQLCLALREGVVAEPDVRLRFRGVLNTAAANSGAGGSGAPASSSSSGAPIFAYRGTLLKYVSIGGGSSKASSGRTSITSSSTPLAVGVGVGVSSETRDEPFAVVAARKSVALGGGGGAGGAGGGGKAAAAADDPSAALVFTAKASVDLLGKRGAAALGAGGGGQRLGRGGAAGAGAAAAAAAAAPARRPSAVGGAASALAAALGGAPARPRAGFRLTRRFLNFTERQDLELCAGVDLTWGAGAAVAQSRGLGASLLSGPVRAEPLLRVRENNWALTLRRGRWAVTYDL
jgi:hypothetical protein